MADDTPPEPRPIVLTRASVTDAERAAVLEALDSVHLHGDGPFSKRCEEHLEALLGAERVLLTHSCTGALEMAAILLEIGPGDEVILPSFTFVSTANAFVLRGATPVFADVRADTLNLDAEQVAAALTERTRAIVPVHYAGIGADLSALGDLADAAGVPMVEDAAQAVGARRGGRQLGSVGALGALSFHGSKNLVAGEGGALVVNDPALVHRAEVLREKGTDRSAFLRGEVDKYTWQDLGSSFLMGELSAALLSVQLGRMEALHGARRAAWSRYHEALEPLEAAGRLRRPVVPEDADHNGHIYYVLLEDFESRERLRKSLSAQSITAPFHYVPLHTSPAGRRFGRSVGELPVTCDAYARLLRLPLHAELTADEQDRVLAGIEAVLSGG
jgi:dTDP-4-amino-4,6-dideoxygalactose transaminase